MQSLPPAPPRDNNFNLLRAIAATLVVATHAFAVTGAGQLEPMVRLFGVSMGTYAVDIFFVISGYLITKSWDRRRSPWDFLRARFLRIYPALWLCIAFCVGVVGLSLTTLAPKDFARSLDTWKFVLENGTLLLRGVYTKLPGTFATHPETSVNLPLWTLPYELKMYLGLLALGATGLLHRRFVVAAIAIGAGVLYTSSLVAGPIAGPAVYARFAFFFASGAWLHLAGARLPLRWPIPLALLVIVIASLGVAEVAWRTVALAVATPYLVIFLALVPDGPLRQYNRVGDYSYGLYVYGYPVQQSLVALAGGGMSVVENLVGTIAVAGLLAVLSWHFVESPALALVHRRRKRMTPRAAERANTADPSAAFGLSPIDRTTG